MAPRMGIVLSAIHLPVLTILHIRQNTDSTIVESVFGWSRLLLT